MKQSRKQQPTTEPMKPDQLEVTKTVQPPPIEDTLGKVNQVLKIATRKRDHRCRVCHSQGCTHYQREYLDTGEEFDQNLMEATDEEL